MLKCSAVQVAMTIRSQLASPSLSHAMVQKGVHRYFIYTGNDHYMYAAGPGPDRGAGAGAGDYDVPEMEDGYDFGMEMEKDAGESSPPADLNTRTLFPETWLWTDRFSGYCMHGHRESGINNYYLHLMAFGSFVFVPAGRGHPWYSGSALDYWPTG